MNLLLTSLLASALVPLGSGDWKHLSFRGLESNTLRFSEGRLVLQVDRSASPMIHAFAAELLVGGVVVTGRVEGRLEIPAEKLWDPAYDDAYLRIGVVEAGDKRLNALQRAAAPSWLRELDAAFGGSGRGIGAVHYHHLVPHASWIGETRVNPSAELFKDRIVATPAADGSFRMEIQFDRPVRALGLWLQADGDDTESTFSTVVERIELQPSS